MWVFKAKDIITTEDGVTFYSMIGRLNNESMYQYQILCKTTPLISKFPPKVSFISSYLFQVLFFSFQTLQGKAREACLILIIEVKSIQFL